MKLTLTQPAAFKAIPEQNGIRLPGELVNAPAAFLLNLFAGRVERNAVELAYAKQQRRYLLSRAVRDRLAALEAQRDEIEAEITDVVPPIV